MLYQILVQIPTKGISFVGAQHCVLPLRQRCALVTAQGPPDLRLFKPRFQLRLFCTDGLICVYTYDVSYLLKWSPAVEFMPMISFLSLQHQYKKKKMLRTTYFLFSGSCIVLLSFTSSIQQEQAHYVIISENHCNDFVLFCVLHLPPDSKEGVYLRQHIWN